MEFVQNFPFFSIILMLASGVITSVLKPKKAQIFTLFALGLVFVMSLSVLSYCVVNNTAYNFMMGHFPAPWGNEIRIGILESLFAVFFTGIMILCILGGLKEVYEETEKTKANFFFTICLLLMSSLLALIYTNDLFNAYVFVEINTITACALVMFRYRSGKALVATMRYLIMSLLGSGLFLIGISMIYDLTGHLLMQNIAQSVALLFESGQYAFPLGVTIALLSMGLAIKSGCFPFHTWLPDVYDESMIGSTAILSSIVSKGYIFLLIKIFYRMIGMQYIFETKATDVLFVFAVCAMLIGSYKAIKVKNIKQMLAYSSVAQIGYIYLGIGLGTTVGLVAACLQILIHAITKPMMFIAAGGFMRVSNGSRNYSDLQGAGYRDRLAGVAFIVGALSMIGIPFFAGFASKALLTMASIEFESVQTIVALITLAISTILNAIYYIPVLMTLFTKPNHEKKHEKFEMRYSYVFSLVVFIALNFILGVFSQPLIDAIRNGISMFA